MNRMIEFEIKNNIIQRNNSYIIQTISFYENVLLNLIIKPFLFNDNYGKYKNISDFIDHSMTFMDKFKITCEIAKIYRVRNFKNFNSFIEIRNKIAHNLTYIYNFNVKTKETQLFFDGKDILWNEYLEIIKKWTELSLGMAEFVTELHNAMNNFSGMYPFMYCEFDEKGILLPKLLIFDPKFGRNISITPSMQFYNEKQNV